MYSFYFKLDVGLLVKNTDIVKLTICTDQIVIQFLIIISEYTTSTRNNSETRQVCVKLKVFSMVAFFSKTDFKLLKGAVNNPSSDRLSCQ